MSGPLRRDDGNTDFEHPTLFFLRNDLEAETAERVSHQAPLPHVDGHTFDLQRGTCSSQTDQQS